MSNRFWSALLLILAGIAWTGVASAADPPPAAPGGWKIGLGRADISPEKPVWLYGYARPHRSERVRAPIYAKAMAIEDEKGQRGVIVTMDLGPIYPPFYDAVYNLVAKDAGVTRDRLLINASHSLCSPDISDNPDVPYDAVKSPEIDAYTKSIHPKIARAILDAVQDLQPGELAWGTGLVPFVINRREATPAGFTIGVNPRGPIDRSVPVLKISKPGGALRGVIFGCACHNTTVGPEGFEICGEFAGYAQSYLEDQNPGIQAMFVTGCAGEANPYPRKGPNQYELAEQHGRTLGVEVVRVLAGPLEPVRPPLAIASTVLQLPFRTNWTVEQLKQLETENTYTKDNAEHLIQLLEAHKPLPASQPTPVSVWQFGNDLTLVALSGEVVVDYVYLIEQAFGPRKLWIAAYFNDVFGTVTSRRVQQEGGYEANGVTKKGFFADNTQDQLLDAVRQLADKVGRK